ncbi:uncharacterized protein PV09_09162 [Verruconis gallopava]|uniref:Phospholipid/glycerol acyltransferase domain-containing protein n=1 Tax=Verruconis gallopava TaxID=253628 RepID=A0A0D1XAB8_9PEZI|nr:uncharacterized protein PV09_09162 [Verruconis gallopava]KIV99130.1 hypothetical protein PV09_09162 [Verruconis gallopava]
MATNPLADLGAGLSTKSPVDHPDPDQHGPLGRTERAFTAASTFLLGLMAISATQFFGVPLKMIDPKFYEAYMAFTKQSFGVLITTMTQWWAPTVVRVSGDRSIPNQLFRRADGSLECRFPKRLVMMANHQLYTDWLYLWWAAYTNSMHGYIYIILKESLKKIPIVGWGAQFYNFIFLKRKWEEDKDSLQQHLNRLNNQSDPMWLLIFPEGTNLAKGTREKSAQWAKERGLQDMKHQLLPRSKGLQFCLKNLKETTEWLYDCTIGYEGIPPGQFGQDIYTLRSSMFEGRPPKSVNMHFRRFKVTDIPVNSEAAFDVWLRNRWREKDYLLEHFVRHNSFPEDSHWLIKQRTSRMNGPHPAKIIETQIKSNSLEEFLSIFAPLSSIMAVLLLFYGGGNTDDFLKMIGEAEQQQQNTALGWDDESQAERLKLQKTSPSTSGSGIEKARIASQVLVPSKVLQNMLQQYVAAIRPATEDHIKLSDNAQRELDTEQGVLSPRTNRKPNVLVQKTSTVQNAFLKAPGITYGSRRTPSLKGNESANAAPSASSRNPVKRLNAGAPANSLSRLQHDKISNDTSTVHPHDSVSPVHTPKAKPLFQQEKLGFATAKHNEALDAAPMSKKKRIIERSDRLMDVSADTAMLMTMKTAHKVGKPIPVRMSSQMLARMKAQGK